MTRTDEHRPSAINPGEYQWVAQEYAKVEDLGDAYFLQSERKIIQDHMKRTGGTYSRHEHGGNCMVCGSVNALYTILFYHEKSNTYVRMGADCAQKCDIAGNYGDVDAFRTKVQNAREAQAGKKKAQALLTEQHLSQAWELYKTSNLPCNCGSKGSSDIHDETYVFRCTCPFRSFKYEETTIVNMVGNLVKYGNLSEKQFNFIKILLEKIDKRAEIEAARNVEKEAAANCPSGKIRVRGKVLSVKVDNNGPYGPTTKMLVQHESGWKVWGTRPSGTNVDRGDVIEFNATVTVSPNDPKFGFYSRPSSPEVISRAETTVA